MLTTTVAGRTWDFSHAIGATASSGAGFAQPNAVAVGPGGELYVLSRAFQHMGCYPSELLAGILEHRLQSGATNDNPAACAGASSEGNNFGISVKDPYIRRANA